MSRALLLTVALLVAASSTPAGAEIYRWTDAEGREHFTSDLHQVPEQYRGDARRGAQAEAEKGEKPDNLNTMGTSWRSPARRSVRGRRRASPPAAMGRTSCGAERTQAAKLRSKVERLEQRVELEEDRYRRLVRLEDRLRAENRAERYRIDLERAEQEYEDFLARMRQKGVEPGCLR